MRCHEMASPAYSEDNRARFHAHQATEAAASGRAQNFPRQLEERRHLHEFRVERAGERARARSAADVSQSFQKFAIRRRVEVRNRRAAKQTEQRHVYRSGCRKRICWRIRRSNFLSRKAVSKVQNS